MKSRSTIGALGLAAAATVAMLGNAGIVAAASAPPSVPPTTLAAARTPAAATSPCTAVPAGVALVVPTATGAATVTSSGSTAVPLTLPGTAYVAVRGPGGTMWIETGDGLVGAVVRVAPDGTAPTTVATGAVSLTGVGYVDGRSAATYVDFDTELTDDGDSDTNGSQIVDFADGEVAFLGSATGPEYGTATLTPGAGWVADGGYADLGEYFDFLSWAGDGDAEYVDPTDDALYNAPPLYSWPILSDPATEADPVLLSWVEGPDIDGSTDPVDAPLVGDWQLVVADAISGAESNRVVIDQPLDARLLHASFDGRFWVGSFGAPVPGDDTARTPSAVTVVDLDAATVAPVDAGCTGVIATLDRADSVPTVLAPATPTTTDPASCPDYTDAPNEYPIERCDSGANVFTVQAAINHAGYELEFDGNFGPGTETAVRQFQADRSLEVDGLVGPDTWAELVTTWPLLDISVDRDLSGLIDPWEVALDEGLGETAPSTPDVGTPPDEQGCDSYQPADDTLPLRNCDEGFSVGGLQVALVNQGYDIGVDGQFGNETFYAVLDFQLVSGLDSDGLVGPDTWAALIAGKSYPDADGDGTVEPTDVWTIWVD